MEGIRSAASAPTRRRLFLAGLFLAVSTGFVLFCDPPSAIWDDSSFFCSGMTRPELVAHFQAMRAGVAQNPAGTIAQHIRQTFASLGPPGYRPLIGIYQWLNIVFFSDPYQHSLMLRCLIGTIYGAFAVTLFLVARRFVQRDLTALGVVLFVFASPPLAATSWVFLVGVQAVVPLLFCCALLCYWAWLESRLRVPALAGLAAIMLLGPWYREFLGLIPVLIGFLEVQRARRPTALGGLAALGLLHAVFPTALVKLLFFPDLPLVPVYQLGHLSNAMGASPIRWFACYHFLPLFPPLLLCAALAGGLVTAGATMVVFVCRPSRAWLPIAADTCKRGVSLLLAAAPILWLVIALVLFLWGPSDWQGLVLCLGIAAVGLQRSVFVTFWFLMAFIPILRVFTEHVHFLYAMTPAAIILLWAVEDIWLSLETPGLPRAWARHALAGVLAIAAADQAMNLYGVYRVNNAMYGGIDNVAAWFQQNAPAGSFVVCNALHGEEVMWHSDHHFENFFTITAGATDARRTLETPEKLKAFLLGSPVVYLTGEARRGDRKVYFLDVDFDYLPDKFPYHSHKYVHLLDVPKRDLGVVHVSQALYPYVDPLRYLISRQFVPFLGAPDLVNDFYCGPAADGSPFCYEVYANYHVYEVTGTEIKPVLRGPIGLAQADVYGFNIISVGAGYHAVPQFEGAFDIEKFQRHGYSAQFSGLTLEEVVRQIQASLGPQ
jgi:hypothetical protein